MGSRKPFIGEVSVQVSHVAQRLSCIFVAQVQMKQAASAADVHMYNA